MRELDCEENWVSKNWCFWTVVLEKTLESPLDCREIQSILKEISPGFSLERMMLKLNLQYFGHLMRSVDLLEKTLMLGGTGGTKNGGRQRMRWLDGFTDSMDVRLSECRRWWWTVLPGMLRFLGLQRVWHDWVTEVNWTEQVKELNLIVGKIKRISFSITSLQISHIGNLFCICKFNM